MADRITLEDFSEHTGCRHVLEAQAKNALRNWFTTPVSGLTPFARLQTALTTAIPTVTWNTTNVKRAIAAFIADEPE
jgi:hypothetical protein